MSLTAAFVIFDLTWVTVSVFMWLGVLGVLRRLRRTVIAVSLVMVVYVSFHMPSTSSSTKQYSPYEHLPVEGTIQSDVHFVSGKISFTLYVEKMNAFMNVVYFYTDDDMVTEDMIQPLKYGASCLIEERPERPSENTNPGEFDYSSYLAQRNIQHQIILSSLERISCTGSSPLNSIFQLRNKLVEHVRHSVDPEVSGWLNALIFGDNNDIEDPVLDLFRRWSLSHLLAISGLHIGLVIAMLYTSFVTSNMLTKEKTGWLIMAILPVYALLAGGAPSVWRASLMAITFLMMRKLGSSPSLTDVLSVIFIVTIIVNPYIVYHIGFQFSFLVTFGLVLSKTWLAQTFHNPFYTLLKISFTSQMIILPLQITYFYTFNPLSILLNVVIVPYFTFFVIPAMFVILAVSMFSGVVHPLTVIFAEVHDIVISMVMTLDDVLYVPFVIGSFPLWGAVIYYLLFIWMMVNMQMNKGKQAFKRGLAIVSLIILVMVRPYVSPTGTVTMLDIGQGDAVVIELPYRKGIIMIDAGGQLLFDGEGVSDKVYKRMIQPFLLSRGIGHVDAIFLTHEDIDHIGSATHVIDDFNVKTVYISNYFDLKHQFKDDMMRHQINVQRLEANTQLQVGGHPFLILSPSQHWGSSNDNSLTIMTTFGHLSWLFTGDAGEEVEAQLIDQYPNLNVNVLKVGHHGSQTSSTEQFLHTIQPEYALISAGRNSHYGHPHPQVVKNLEAISARIYRTDVHGAVMFHFDKESGHFQLYQSD
nr:DNA internalization-related competence protein ComEC/Rec2 [Lentibacillus saliphilus]